jgi:hypothetical protein
MLELRKGTAIPMKDPHTQSICSVELRDQSFLRNNFGNLKEFSYGVPDLLIRIIFHEGALAGTKKTLALIMHTGLRTSPDLAIMISRIGLSTFICGSPEWIEDFRFFLKSMVDLPRRQFVMENTFIKLIAELDGKGLLDTTFQTFDGGEAMIVPEPARKNVKIIEGRPGFTTKIFPENVFISTHPRTYHNN